MFFLLRPRHHPDLPNRWEDPQFNGFTPAFFDRSGVPVNEIHGSHQRTHAGPNHGTHTNGCIVEDPHHADVHEPAGATTTEGKHR